jgi:polysaccharide export outer membrane protein
LSACAQRQAYVQAPGAVAVAAAPVVAVAAGGPYAPAPGVTGYDTPYQLDAGDRLRSPVFGQEGLTNSYIVDAAGYVSITLIGSVPARGLTTAELARRIAERLRNGYIRNPHVSVEVEAYRPFFILGEVNAPGQYPYVPNMTVEAAVAIAGGFAPRANKSDVLIGRSYNGETMRGKVPPDFPLRPGDTITVRERWF